MKHLLFPCFLAFIPNLLCAQNKKALDHADIHRWRKIEQQKISNDGQWVVWAQTPVGEGDPTLHLWNATSGATVVFPRSTEAQLSDDSKWLAFKIKPAVDSLKALRRKKVKDEDLPKDTLGIYDLTNARLEKIPRLKNFSMPEKWSGWLAFQIETEKVEKAPPTSKDSVSAIKADTAKTLVPKPVAAKPAKKSKKEDKDNGFRLIVQHLPSGKRDTFAYVKEFVLAKRAPRLLYYSTGKGDTLTFAANLKSSTNGLYWADLEKDSIRTCLQKKGKYQQLAIDEWGTQAAFVADFDSSKARIRPWQLCLWSLKDASTLQFANTQVNASQTPDWGFSEHTRPVFSKAADKLYFGMAPPPILNDTTLLKEEIVDVEVWAWNDKRLYTQEETRLENEKKRSYPYVYHIDKKRIVPLGSPELPEIRFQEDRNASLALGFTEEPYTAYLTSEGTAHKDLFAVNIDYGAKTLIVKDLRCNPSLSPEGKYISWWSDPDTAWFAWNASTNTTVRLTNNLQVPYYNEENDVPDYPGEYGMAGWLEGDYYVILYDKYDLWKIDPNGKEKPLRLTNGRSSNTTYRYIKLDPEQRSIPYAPQMLLHKFNHADKSEGYAWLDLSGNNGAITWMFDAFAYSKAPQKAKNADLLLFSKENYQTFPDLQLIRFNANKKAVSSAHDRIERPVRVSNANPQQSEFQWGNIEMVSWISLTGEKINGLLVKPDGFDPQKQYPMIVNFYERLSDELNRHRTPDFHRSQINFTFYASRGYLVFAPDIPYRIGYPGESAYDAIMSGVTSLIAKGFVDPKRVALQGHSWGGYQSAYLVTRTNLFACAEAGAPVANMTSAYGGIRWESGLNRAFQYEHQQSRIGGSLWEKPKQFIENSPLFALDKVETPLLIMANDKDGAVPWYQGIELFSGLRRLGKPAWLLNYNDEPHWPVKLQNRVDFQKRMQQFFDRYLLAAPEPSWMKRGVPPMEKGILQGY